MNTLPNKLRQLLQGHDGMTTRQLSQLVDTCPRDITRADFEKYIQKTKDYIRSNGNLVVEIT